MTDPLEDALRQLLHHRAREVDTGPPVRPLDLTTTQASAPPRRVERTWLAAVGSAAAVVAITVGAVVGLRALPGDRSPAGPASPQTSTSDHPTSTPPAPATIVPIPAEPTTDSPAATPSTGTATTPTPVRPRPSTGTAPEPAPTATG